jgi:hypothetical protein
MIVADTVQVRVCACALCCSAPVNGLGWDSPNGFLLAGSKGSQKLLVNSTQYLTLLFMVEGSAVG